ENSDHLMAQVLGITVFDKTYQGESPTVDHLSFSEQILLDPATLEAAANEITIHIHDLPLAKYEKKGDLSILKIPGIVSIDASLDLKAELDLEGAISFGEDGNGDFGLLSPTFIGVNGQVTGTASGSIKVAGVDAATLEGTVSASLELDYGLSTNVPLGNFE